MAKSVRGGATRLSPEVRVAEIEVAARLELAEKGSHNFLPSEVARRCGVSEATIYRYFPTKRDLLIRVAETWFGEILAVEPELSHYPDLFGRLRHVIWHSLSVVRKEPSLTRYVLLELRPDPDYRLTPVFELNRRFTSYLTDLVREAVAKGVFRPDVPPTLVRNMVYGCIEHETWSFLRGEGDFDVNATADGIANMVFRGLSTVPMPGSDLLAAKLYRLESSAEGLSAEIRGLKALLTDKNASSGRSEKSSSGSAPKKTKPVAAR